MPTLAKYITGYRNLLDSQDDGQQPGIEDFFRRLKKDLPKLQDQLLRQERLHAPHYNIFHALHIDRRETVLHSPMLAHLLDPTASHGQGYLFLQAFLDVAHINRQVPLPDGRIDSAEWTVRQEIYIGNGSIDLLIECPALKYVLVIENKVDASEQYTQLWRYHQWMVKHRSGYSTRQLIFLTPTGHTPESHKAAPCVLMSYRKDIREFLSQTIDEIKPTKVSELVKQYKTVIDEWAQEETNEETE